jgi:acyl-homoserine lactone synthase
MLHILEGVLPGESQLLEQAFHLRHNVFVREAGWVLNSFYAREIDQFDGRYAVYLIVTRENEVVGNLRLLPSYRPHLLSTLRRHVCQETYAPDYQLWEWSRVCVRKDLRGFSKPGSVMSELILGALEWGLDSNVTEVLVEFETRHIARYMEFGCDVQPLGLPHMEDGLSYTAVRMKYGPEAVENIRAFRGQTGPVPKVHEWGLAIQGKPPTRAAN